MDHLGHSLLLEDGDLVVRDRGLAPVTGIANLMQALKLRLLTPYGSDRFNNQYGLSAGGAFTRPVGTRELEELLRLEIVRTLAADPRVHEVVDVSFTGNSAERVWSVAVVVEAVDGRTTALTAELEV